tara:strand:- start:11407 stop:11889 length:483 start_codon:yes stop_codon:yes gene_type:complete
MPDLDYAPGSQAKYRCYGNNAALTIEATALMTKGEPVGWTVNIDVAPIANRQANWQEKVTVQASESELPVLCAVLLGLLPKCQIKRSGKGVYFERQDGVLFVRGSQNAKNYALPLPIGQTFHVSALAIKQLHRHLGGDMDTDLMLAAIRGAAGLYKPKAQ